MEFEQNGRTYGKTMEFLFWWKKCVLSFKKSVGIIRPDFEMWFQGLLLGLALHYTGSIQNDQQAIRDSSNIGATGYPVLKFSWRL